MSTPPCQRFACNLQNCIEKYAFERDPEVGKQACQKALENLHACCRRLRDKGQSSSVCPEVLMPAPAPAKTPPAQ
ncbi:hypothetical protein H696_05359 [Fonticula alba]|uniref:Cx9C motif-containing protein 4, mitochondrial n=1 Tax=Fonticula alba TaxID=691883 RepID=A0A058Z1U9_FONAL|nr:hypothetical protein H696_05359 [Fonticula alba]KCV68106.1 hypothetical protein H696_05359 [Fonticula alba]|eukprot:XP_009497480.1 hypothetical protein H696_05359 [Fonticula alba]